MSDATKIRFCIIFDPSMEFITTIIVVKRMELNFCSMMLLHKIKFIEKLLIFQVQKNY